MGNIPAPDLFDDQITCINNLPPAKGPGARPNPTRVPKVTDANPRPMSDLDVAIGKGAVPINLEADIYSDLTYIVDPEGSNCGGGTEGGATQFDADPEMEGPVATDVAAGYTEVLDKFMGVYGDTGTAERRDRCAGKHSLLRIRTMQTTKDLQDGLTEALADDTKARSALNAIAGGPIYQAGIAEWMAKGAVERSVTDYNKAVGNASDASDALDLLQYDDYVPAPAMMSWSLSPTESLRLPTGVGSVDPEQLRQYTNANGDMVADVEENGMTDVSESNFDKTGKLVVPTALTDHDDDPSTAQVYRPAVAAGDDSQVPGYSSCSRKPQHRAGCVEEAARGKSERVAAAAP